MLSSCANNSYMSGVFPNAFQSFTHLILMASLWGRCHYFARFTGEETGNQRSPPNRAASKWQNQNSHPGVWLHLLVTLLSFFSREKKSESESSLTTSDSEMPRFWQAVPGGLVFQGKDQLVLTGLLALADPLGGLCLSFDVQLMLHVSSLVISSSQHVQGEGQAPTTLS